jgi:hypothetical protein
MGNETKQAREGGTVMAKCEKHQGTTVSNVVRMMMRDLYEERFGRRPGAKKVAK